MKGEIISVGTELLLGQICNTDAQFISKEAAEIGVDIYYHTAVGDNRARLLNALKIASERSELIITTGGLGPTEDGLTKETITEFLNLKLVEYPEARLHVVEHFHSKKMPQSNKKQWMFPEGSLLIPNNNGTAPGCIIEKNSKIFIVLPGPPNELQPMVKETVIPYIISKEANNYVIKSRILKLFGLSESETEEKIKDLIDNQTNPTIAPLVGKSEVTLRLTAKAHNAGEAYDMITGMEQKIRDRIGEYIYGIDEDTLPIIVTNLLISRKFTIAIAESCTGGNITNLLTDISGVSQSLKLGEITYSNESKISELGISKDIIEKYGAVSRETAIAMAEGIRKKANTDIGLSVTGIAGPDSIENKPVGLFYVGISSYYGGEVYEFLSRGTRMWFKNYASLTALNELRKYIMKYTREGDKPDLQVVK
ncbi:MAG: competence/damage-inducible protein A [Thermoanaerobacteraceae bacterium]|nr:competence/damage-inducible protein A [Thermoanaerobacteraceae bacterium]